MECYHLYGLNHRFVLYWIDETTKPSGRSFLVERFGLLQQLLSGFGLSSEWNESLKFQSFSSSTTGLSPFVVFSSGGHLLGDDFSVLALDQISLFQSTDGFFL